MKTSIQFKQPRKLSGLLILLILSSFALSQSVQAVVPPPDGGYPNFNTAEGQNALFSLATGAANTAVGWYSLFSDTGGSFNTATGAGALLSNTADANTAFGAAALLFNTTGIQNTAVGGAALLNNNGGGRNTALGFRTLHSNIAGDDNAAVGAGALLNSTGSGNIAVGLLAGEAITSGDGNVCIGSNVAGEAGVSDTTYIRNVNTLTQPIVAGIDGLTVRLSDGRLGHGVSSRRFKEDIKSMDRASEVLYALKPVTFHYKKEIDPTQTFDFGLIAEEVAEVNPELAVRDREGKVTNYRRDAINAMLLNEFLKEHQKVEDLKKDFQATVAQLTAELREQAAQIQKVSAQLEASKPAPQVALNNP
jgi:hypothetical protein